MDNETVIDENKRKLNDQVDDGNVNKRLKTVPSLGLSLLQAYDEEEHISSDEEVENVSSKADLIDKQSLTRIESENHEGTNDISTITKIEDQLDAKFTEENVISNVQASNEQNDAENSGSLIETLVKSRPLQHNINIQELQEVVSVLSNNESEIMETNNDKQSAGLDHGVYILGKDKSDGINEADKSESKPVKKFKLNRSKFTKDSNKSNVSLNSSSSSNQSNSSPSSVSALSSFYDKNSSYIDAEDKTETNITKQDFENVPANDVVNKRAEIAPVHGITENSRIENKTLNEAEVNKKLESTAFVNVSENSGIYLSDEEKVSDSPYSIENPTNACQSFTESLVEVQDLCSPEEEMQISLTETVSPIIRTEIEDVQSNINFDEEDLQPIKLIDENELEDSPDIGEPLVENGSVGQDKYDATKCEKLTQGSDLTSEDLLVVKNELLLKSISKNVQSHALISKEKVDSIEAHQVNSEALSVDVQMHETISKVAESTLQCTIIPKPQPPTLPEVIKELQKSEESVQPSCRVSTPTIEISDEEEFEDAVDTSPSDISDLQSQPQMFVIRPGEPSKLEQALTGMLNRSSQNRIPDSVKPAQVASPAPATDHALSSSSASSPDCANNIQKSEDIKQNIKLHLSVQGDRVSIKNPDTHVLTPATTVNETGVRIKRPYRRRTKVELEAEQANAKEYAHRLRQRTADRLTPGAKKRGPKGPRKKKLEGDGNQNLEFSNIPTGCEASLNLPVKVQPIKLKINKNASVTIKSAASSQPSDYLFPRMEEQTSRVQMVSSEDAFRSTWTETNMQRVERMLKGSNVTITPVSTPCQMHSQHSPHPPRQDMQQSSIRAMLTAPPKNMYQRSDQPVSFSQTLSLGGMTQTIATSSAASVPVGYTQVKPLNISLRPIDSMQQTSEWCVTHKMSEDRESQSRSQVGGGIPARSTFDVKSEIRKKIAMAEKQKQEMNFAAAQSGGVPYVKADKTLPDLVAINKAMLPGSPMAESVHKMLSGKCEPMAASTPNLKIPPGSAHYSAPSIMQPTELFAKRRGRPSKAMVAAREAYKQQQEEISRKMMTGNFPSVTTASTPILPHTLPAAMATFPSESVPIFSPVSAQTSALPSTPITTSLISGILDERDEKTDENQISQSAEDSTFPLALQSHSLSEFQIAHPSVLIPKPALMTESELAESTPILTSAPTPTKARRGRRPKERKNSDEQVCSEPQLPDPEKEAEEQRRLEEERIRKEEERERKNEIRRIRAKERSDLAKAKRLRQKQKAKERHKAAKERKRLQMEEKKKLEEQLKRMPAFDDETRMSADNGETVHVSYSTGLMEDQSSNASNDASQKKKSRMEVTDVDSQGLMVDQIAEYQWPIQGGELYMIQEQVSNFLGVKSFKRKYPDIKRRSVDLEERAYLVDSGLVSETLCDLGITAVCSAEVLDIMFQDFPIKYEEFRKYTREKQMKELSYKQKAWAIGLGYKLLMADGSKQDLKKRAMESTSNWNAALNKNRLEDRKCHMDLQTFVIHYPKTKCSKMTIPSPKVGSYPVSILPGQFCDFYKDYTPTELRYLPVNTVLYGPLKHPVVSHVDDGNQSDSDDSSSSDESSTTSEGTQATEDTNEEIDRDMSVDETNDKPLPDTTEKETDTSVPHTDLTVSVSNETVVAIDINACKVCLGDEHRNKHGQPEVLIRCSQCSSNNHPTCLDLSLCMVEQIKSYDWQCPDCKSCVKCKENADEDKMLFCDTCDRGLHIYCVGLKKVPTGSWQCDVCSISESSVAAINPENESTTLVAVTPLIQIAG